MTLCKFPPLVSLLLSGAAFMPLMPLISLGSSAEEIGSLLTTPLANVSNVRRVLDENLEVDHQLGKLRMFSLIVVADSMHATGPFQDRARVETYGGSAVAAVQFTRLGEVGDVPYVQGREPFEIGHPEGVDRRVRIVHFTARRSRRMSTPNENQISHLKASCEDHSETTVVVVADETCIAEDFWSEPCGSNDVYIFRNYQSSLPSPEEAPTFAYIPIGPRDTFPFLKRSRHLQPLACSRRVFFNLQVSAHTSPRRDALINMTTIYAAEHPDIQVHLSGSNLFPYQWVDLLQQSKFTLCPGGHNPETYRMYEALETGSIPIVSKQDYLDPAYLSPHICGEGPASWNTVAASPFAQAVSVDSWEELPQLLDRLAQMADDTINQLQVDCEQWYAAIMRGTYASLLSPGSFPKFWPQNGPITPFGLDESSDSP